MSMNITEDVRVAETPRPQNNVKGTTPLTPEEIAAKAVKARGARVRGKGPDEDEDEGAPAPDEPAEGE